MGNCTAKPKQNLNLNQKEKKKIQTENAIQLRASSKPKPMVFLFGDPNSSSTSYLRFVLLYKPLILRFVPNEGPEFKVRFETEEEGIWGSTERVLEHVESKLPLPALVGTGRERKKLLEWLGRDEETTPCWEIVKMVVLQHRSMRWHLQRLLETPNMELGNMYANLLEIMLEHAQMEERVLLPILLSKHPGACSCVNEEHGRDLPVMNGIKEDIKSVGVLNAGTCTHKEAFQILSIRLKALKDSCNQHFDEEEKNMLPLMETTNLTQDQEWKIINHCVDVMQGTHSHLFPFFIEGLLPHEAMEYLDLIGSYINKDKFTSLLHLLVHLSS